MYILKITFILLLFSLGLYFVINKPLVEGYTEPDNSRCPNVLIQRGTTLYLSNSKLADVPGVNPLKFNNLNEYVQFMKWQRGQGIRCPVLYLQEVYNTQGERIYKARPSPENMQGGLRDSRPQEDTKLLDAGRDDPPYNRNSFPAHDPQGQYIGLETPLDNMYDERLIISNSNNTTNSAKYIH
jgi:hypothetical protein